MRNALWRISPSEVLFLDTVSGLRFPILSLSFLSFLHYSSCSSHRLSVSPSVCPSRWRSREPGSGWLSAPRVAREKATMATLWLGGSLSERTSPWPSPRFNLPMSLSSTARSPLVPLGSEMPPLCSKSSVSWPSPFGLLYDVNVTFSFSFERIYDLFCYRHCHCRFMALIRSACVFMHTFNL